MVSINGMLSGFPKTQGQLDKASQKILEDKSFPLIEISSEESVFEDGRF